MVGIGINGLGRIGKLVFLQLIENNANIKAINVPDFDAKNLKTYLTYDSVHNLDRTIRVTIENDDTICVNGRTIKLLNCRDATKLQWKSYGVNYVIDATGVYLTEEKAKEHDCDYLIMCAPAKDDTPSFMVHGNHEKYSGEKIVNNVSCTSNSIIPILKQLHHHFGIKEANFITIHSTTASQQTVDTVKFKNRTSRSIFNNIIPHTTGASKAIYKILPQLEGKIHGTSVRVPVSNVSLIDLNVTVDKDCDLAEILSTLDKYEFIEVDDNKFKISCDYNTTKCPCIIDKKACMEMQKNQFKLSIWYDNEYSYSNKVTKLLEHMMEYNQPSDQMLSKQHFLESKDFSDKRVVLRLDWNVPTKDHIITDFFRILSTVKTIQYILAQNPKYVLIVTHMGRPASKEDMHLSFYSYLEQINNVLRDQLGKDVVLIDSMMNTVKTDLVLQSAQHGSLFLLDNIRFIPEETNKTSRFETVKEIYLNLGDIFVNDAFGCSHRDHLSITAPLEDPSTWCYGYLIQNEISALSDILHNNTGKKVLAIMGGAKMDDKLPILDNLSTKIDGIYIAGGNINGILKQEKYASYISSIRNRKADIHLMDDGLCSESLTGEAEYCTSETLPNNKFFLDIGMQSIANLVGMLNDYDIIFWNGTLGVVENNLYKQGSITLMKSLMNCGKKVIIGGGDTGAFANTFSHNLHYISTGGGASLEYLSHGKLVGLM